MTYSHRRWHAWLWLLLGPLVWAGFLAGAFFQPAPSPMAPALPATRKTLVRPIMAC